MDTKLQVSSETAPLKAVVLGLARSPGRPPTVEEAYDPKSIEFIRKNAYPKEEDMVMEMTAFRDALEKHGVQVYRPELIPDCNQIFSRDIGFVIDDYFIRSNILPQREKELEAIRYLLNDIPADKIITPPEKVHVEGGDVMLCKDHILVGTYYGADYPDIITARTNRYAVDFLKELFPGKTVKAFDLVKSNTDPRKNALHLDCVFQPVGAKWGIIHAEGFADKNDYEYLADLFGKENLLHISADEMYQMFSNVFSISPTVVVSERNFTRLNDWMRSKGITVEEIPYAEIGKQEGLLRCSTLPLYRDEQTNN